jgi:CheY-like chemotaxis protein
MANDEKTNDVSLTAQFSQQLSTVSSLVRRGLQDIADHLAAEAARAAQEHSIELYKERRFEEAIATCNIGLDSVPTDGILWQIKGVCFAERGNYSEALNCIDRALEEQSDNPYCWSIKAHLLNKTGRSHEAIGCDDYAIELEPENPFLRKKKATHLAAYRKSVADALGIVLPTQYSQKAERILVVDDEEPIRKIIRGMLIWAGYRCQDVAGGLEALALLESGEHFDLLLCDLLNSPMDGAALLEQAKQRFPEMLAIVVTAVRDVPVALHCIGMGAYDYFNKPFERDVFLETVRGAFEYRRLRGESGFTAWATDNVARLLFPLVDEHLFIPLADGSRKHVRDLADGDVVSLQREGEQRWLRLVEREDRLTAVDFVPDQGTSNNE